MFIDKIDIFQSFERKALVYNDHSLESTMDSSILRFIGICIKYNIMSFPYKRYEGVIIRTSVSFVATWLWEMSETEFDLMIVLQIAPRIWDANFIFMLRKHLKGIQKVICRRISGGDRIVPFETLVKIVMVTRLQNNWKMKRCLRRWAAINKLKRNYHVKVYIRKTLHRWWQPNGKLAQSGWRQITEYSK